MFGSAEKTSTVVDVSAKDRRDLWASIVVFAGLAGVVIARYGWMLSEQLGSGTVSARLQMSGNSISGITSPSGAEMQVGSVVSLEIPTADLSSAPTVYLRVADLLETLGYVAVLALLTLLVVRFMRGGIFEQRSANLVNAAAIGALLAVLVPALPRTIGGNLVVRDLGWDPSEVDAATFGAQFWPIYAFCMAFSAIAVIVKIGGRMARDQEGLV
ncbi:MAG: hypothetical protein GX610_07935 [Rhodococcus sp.]|nr:hypothetical protein [Rhodococcus sp. (in: high G+C Gram-positive bacteria)]